MPEDPATEDPGTAAAARVQEVVVAGHRGDRPRVQAALADPDPAVRAAAVGALQRAGLVGPGPLLSAIHDPAAVVRLRAVQEIGNRAAGAPTDSGGPVPTAAVAEALRAALDDRDPLVVEMACWALGEWRTELAVPALVETALRHPDTRCREAAVAALGAVGAPEGLDAVLAALDDKPTVRRRATVALAAFDGPEVEPALRRSLEDRDWQVREVAGILLDEDGPSEDGPSG